MLVAVVSAARWRRWPAPAGETALAPAADPLVPDKTRPVGIDGLPETTATETFTGFGDSTGGTGFGGTGYDENRYGDLTRSAAGDSGTARWADSPRGSSGT